jgi:hypothetical protein
MLNRLGGESEFGIASMPGRIFPVLVLEKQV